MKMSKSEEYIEIKSFVVVNPNFPVITKESALKAVAMAEEEMKRKPSKFFPLFWITGCMVVTQTVLLRSLRKD